MDISHQRIANFRLDAASVLDYAARLRRMAYVVCAMEDASRRDQTHAAGPREMENVTLPELLDSIVAENHSYRWDKVGGLLNIFPQDSILDEKIPAVNAKGKGLWRILKEDLGIEKKGLRLFADLEQEEGPLLDIHLEATDIRHALNALVAQFVSTFWQISGSGGAFFLTISTMPDQAERNAAL